MVEPRSMISTMGTQRHYPNAPIAEAIIDLRVELATDITVADLEKVQVGQEDAYPTRLDRNVVRGQMQVGRRVSASATTEQIGYVFRSRDEKQIFQGRLDGFTMSRLSPYQCWESFRDEARRQWNIYRAAVSPQRITRVAVRYINRIDIPLPLEDFSDYVRTVPEVSPDLPQELAGYFMRLDIPMEDIKSRCLLNEAMVEPAAPNVVSVILDIDVFRTEDVPTEEDGLWGFIEELRSRKNSVFEACITDKARELFQ